MRSLLVLFIFLFISVVSGQPHADSILTKNDSTSISLSGMEFSSGKGAVTSGLYIFANFTSDKGKMQVTLSQNDLEITYLYRLFNDKILIGPNIGYFYNVPFGGPKIVFSLIDHISTLHWFGVSFGKPEGEIDLKPSLLFAINSLTVDVWRFNLSYCLINYMQNKPQHTASLKYTQAINRHYSIYTDVGYDFLNQSQLLKIGINWTR